MSALFAMLGMGGTEIIIVFVAVLLLFGPKKLPELARGLGKGIREFKKASNEVTEELQRAVEVQDAPIASAKFPPEGSPAAEHLEHAVPHSPEQIHAPDVSHPPQ